MPLTNNATVIFNEVPSAFPVPGQTLKKIDGSIDLDAPVPSGSALVKTVALSLDPYMRGRMRPPGIKSYVGEFTLHEPISNFGVSKVLKSSSPNYKEGDHLYGIHNFTEYAVLDEQTLKGMRVLDSKTSIPWPTYVGSAGMPGQTAWYGLNNIAKPKKGETIFISAASGAVGQMVAALSQREGVKVVGSAGSDEKVKFLLEELKFDAAFNYRTQDTEEFLTKYGPYQMYWDNVGGPTLDAVLATIEDHGRIVACGSISGYNGEVYGLKNVHSFFAKQLKLEGFIVIQQDIDAFYNTVPGFIASGEIKPKEHIIKGLDNGESFLDLLKGKNFGKAIIVLDE